MNDEDIKLRILRYLDDGFEDTEYIAEIVNALPFLNISALICNLLRSDDYEAFSMTGLFLRDAILYGNRNEACHQFIADYPESSYELIRVEAEYEFQRALKSIQTPLLSKAEQRQRAKDIKKIKPTISFQTASGKFRTYLSSNGLSQYDISELEVYIDREILV
jgi:hypothetical protein